MEQRAVTDRSTRPDRGFASPAAGPSCAKLFTLVTPPNGRRRVVIADDAPELRLLFRRMLEHSTAFEVVGEAADGGEAVRLTDMEHPDLVLLDLAMPVLDGLEAIPELRRCSPLTKIVVLSGFDSERMENEALACGADAYIEKRLRVDELLERILDVCDGAPSASRRVPPLESELSGRVVAADPRLGAAFEHAPNALALGGLNGRFHAVNEPFCRLIGYAETALLKRTFAQVSNSSDIDAQATLQEQLFARSIPSYQLQHRFQHADGSAVLTLLSRTLLPAVAGVAAEVITQVVDLSELAASGISKARAEVERDRLARELVRVNIDLAGLASDDLLAYALAGADPSMGQAVDLEEVMLAARFELTAQISAAEVVLSWEALPVVSGDPALLAQLLHHALRRATKAASPATPARVHVGVARARGAWSITVTGDGEGSAEIGAEGRSICERIAERHGGIVEIDPPLEGGTRFRFTLADDAGLAS